MLCLYIEAPFAACRTFTAGSYRPTATFLTPSAAYGLLLNIAGIESRLREEDEGHDGTTPTSLMRPGLPKVRIALGAPAGSSEPFPTVQTIYQQLHNYPIGTSGKERAPAARGNKYNITPVRREILCGLRALICLDGNPDLEDRVRRGLQGAFNAERYGLPFLGDNQLLLDYLTACSSIPPAYWFQRITAPSEDSPSPRTTRLTIWINRADLSQTQSALYAPPDPRREEPTSDIPESAWTWIEPTP